MGEGKLRQSECLQAPGTVLPVNWGFLNWYWVCGGGVDPVLEPAAEPNSGFSFLFSVASRSDSWPSIQHHPSTTGIAWLHVPALPI